MASLFILLGGFGFPRPVVAAALVAIRAAKPVPASALKITAIPEKQASHNSKSNELPEL